MKPITYSAPAKMILSGEHAVVYGRPALVCALDMRLRLSLSADPAPLTQDLAYIDRVVRSYFTDQNIRYRARPFSIQTESAIPRRRGLGSSAAYCVTAVAAIGEHYTGAPLSRDQISLLAYRAEKQFHQNSSGVDTSVSCFGGLVYYRREFEFLKTISSLTMKIPEAISDRLLLIDSGAPAETTGEMVKAVGNRYNGAPGTYDSLFNRIEKCTKKTVVAVGSSDSKLFALALAENERLLERIGVVSRGARSLIHALRPFGTGKITGAGGAKRGAGYLLFFAREKEACVSYLTSRRIPFLPVTTSPEGVTRH